MPTKKLVPKRRAGWESLQKKKGKSIAEHMAKISKKGHNLARMAKEKMKG